MAKKSSSRSGRRQTAQQSTAKKSSPKKSAAKKSASKKAARKKTAKKASRAARKKSTAASVPDSGPVTLQQAQAMVQAQLVAARPRRAAAASRPQAADVPTPATVGQERERLAERQDDELARRVREYAAMMKIMQDRGVKGLPPTPVRPPRRRAPGAPAAAAAAAGGQPLKIVAEGDSWFDYPVPFFGGGVIPRLQKRLGVPILNLAKAGDEVRYIMGVEERSILITHLHQGSPAGGKWDVLLFSGGGNDIVGNPMALWVNDYRPAVPPAALLHGPRFESALALVLAGYEDLIQLRDALSPTTHLIFHAYDFAIPDGRGICHLGPWLKPTFDLRKFPSRTAAFEVVKVMLQRFATALSNLQQRSQGVTFLNTQGTLPPNTGSWHNELHPSRTGFQQIAELFYAKLKALYPQRVL